MTSIEDAKRFQEIADCLKEIVEFINKMNLQYQADTLFLAEQLKKTQDMFSEFIEDKYPKDVSALHRLLIPKGTVPSTYIYSTIKMDDDLLEEQE